MSPMPMIVQLESVLSCSNFSLNVLKEGSTGTDVKSALTSCELMYSSSCSWYPWAVVQNPWCSGYDGGTGLPGVLISRQVPLLFLV